jgi:hypothetical protein
VIANAHLDTVQLPVVPAWMQKVALAMGAPVGKAIGYGPTHVPRAGCARAARSAGSVSPAT